MELVVYGAFDFRIQRPLIVRQDGVIAKFMVELLQQITDRFGAAARLPGNTADDFGRRAASLDEPPSAVDNRDPFLRRDLAELRPAADHLGIQGDKPIDRALQKAHPLAVADDEAAAD